MSDKVRISAYYEEGTNACHSIEIFMNFDGITARDVADAVRALFNPDALLQHSVTAPRGSELGSTDVIPRVDERTQMSRQPINPPPRVRFNGTRLEAEMPSTEWRPGQHLRGRQ